ncbi:c-type cytochrome [Vibrio penaeicida]|uniref:c-type cytochrome n=1 Tax=Vibrio penaeicida TaxID=104609 RepID=UPI000CEA425C|nr:cytochrome c [Vibrio penaeicida]
MKKYTIFAIVGITSAVIFGSYALSKPNLDGDIVKGQSQYIMYCQSCHGSKGLGDGPAALSLSNQPANLASKVSSFFSTPTSLSKDVLNGNVEEGMPAWKGILTEEDAINILTYVQSIQ